MPGFMLHNQGADALCDQYSIQDENGVLLLFNTAIGGLSAKGVLQIFELYAHHDALVEALEPLGKLADTVFYDGMNASKPDDAPSYGFDGAYLTYGDLRRARAALAAVRRQK